MLSPSRDVLAACAGLVSASLWTSLFIMLVRRRAFTSSLSRKLIHITTAPLFALTFPFYSREPTARIFAAAVPAAFAVRLYLGGVGVTKDPITDAVARRKAHAEEATGGPFWYAVSVSTIVLLTWRERSSTYLALSMLAFGDGSAELGYFFPVSQWPLPTSWQRKSVGGTLSFLAFGSVFAYSMCAVFSRLGLCSTVNYSICLLIAFFCSLLELLPIQDNLSVPFGALLMAECLPLPSM